MISRRAVGVQALMQQLVNSLFSGSVYALFALGFALVAGVLEVWNFAHGAVYMLTAVATYALVARHSLPLAAAVPLALLFAGLLGLLLELAVLRPLRHRGAPPIAALVATIGLDLVIVALLEQARPGGPLRWLWVDGASSVRFPAGSVPDPTYRLAGVQFQGVRLLILALALTVMLALTFAIRSTRFGRAVRAAAENRRAAMLLGIDVDRLMAGTLVLGAMFAGLAGILSSVALAEVSPYIGRQITLHGLAAIVLGGGSSIVGAVVGSYLLALMELVALLFLGPDVRGAVVFITILAVLLLRPHGLFGRPSPERA